MKKQEEKKFIVITSQYLDNIEKKINEQLELGYDLVGDVRPDIASNIQPMYYVCMFKRDVENKKQIL